MTIIHLKKFDLHVTIDGQARDGKIVKLMLNDLLTRNNLIAIFIDDVKRVINNQIKKVVIYEYTPPLNNKEFENLLRKNSRIIFAAYGSVDLLGMHLFNDVQKIIWNYSSISLGSPVLFESDIKTIKVVMLV